jgi:hypothetical protein
LLQLASGLIAFKKARAATLAAAQSAKSCGSACWRHCGVRSRTADSERIHRKPVLNGLINEHTRAA